VLTSLAGGVLVGIGGGVTEGNSVAASFGLRDGPSAERHPAHRVPR
jgi:hypothetical protein